MGTDWTSIAILAVVAVLGATWLIIKEKREKISWALIALLTIFVGHNIRTHVIESGRLTQSPTLIDADRAELMLKLNSCIKLMTRVVGRADNSGAKLVSEAEGVLEPISERESNNAKLAAKLILVCHEGGKSVSVPMSRLSHIDSEDARDYQKILTAIVDSKRIDAQEANLWESKVDHLFEPGWYREDVQLSLYRLSGQRQKYESLSRQLDDRSQTLFFKLLGVMSVIALSLVLGVIVILVQLFFLPRQLTPPEEAGLVRSPDKYRFKIIYGTFLAWLATQMGVGVLAQTILKDMNVRLASLGVLAAAISTAAIYLVSNGPGLVYSYFFAYKAHGVKLLDGLRLRFRSGKLGPTRLVLAGFLTWLAAVPLVLISYIIAFTFLHSKGSSNPIIALVMEAARSSNTTATAIFYMTVGVFAPLCEESLFRGFLYSSLRWYFGVIPSMAISAGLFAAVHLDPGGFLPLFCLGCLFAFVFERTKSIMPSMVAHGLWNSGTFTLMLLLFGA